MKERDRRFAAALALALAGCAAPAAKWPRPAAAVAAAPRPDPEGPRMRILELEEYASDAPDWVVVVGTVANDGRRTTEEIRITVKALGAADRVVATSPAVARRQRVAPRGRTDFAAAFERRPDVEAYHVKVLAW
jgi:hypothetical protein